MKTPRHLLAVAPVVVLAHVAEEAPGLVEWYNRHVDPDLTMGDFLTFNAIGLLITVLVAVPSSRSRNSLLALGLIAWLSFVMLANGVLHLTASLLFREYVPGTVSAGVLYLPYFVAASATIRRTFGVQRSAMVLAATIGAVPMLVQGFGMLALGRRLLW